MKPDSLMQMEKKGMEGKGSKKYRTAAAPAIAVGAASESGLRLCQKILSSDFQAYKTMCSENHFVQTN